MRKKQQIKELFIDRKHEFALLNKGLMAGKDYVLIAPRRFGKTTLIQKVFSEISKDKDYMVVAIDIMRYSGSVNSLAEGIIESSLNIMGLTGKIKRLLQQMEFSLQMKITYGDLEIEPIIRLMRDKTDDFTLLELSLKLLEKVAIKTNKTLVVFFDEFGELHSLGEQVIKIFRSVIQEHKRVNYVFAGSQETLMTKIFVDKNSAFYRFGDLIYLEGLNREEVIEELNNIKLPVVVIDAILTGFECHPYYTSKIIKDLIVEPENGVSLINYFNYVRNQLIMQEMAYLQMQIQKIKIRAHALDILSNLALGLEINNGLEYKSRQSIFQIVKFLEISGFIKNIGVGRYKLTDPLLSVYLSE